MLDPVAIGHRIAAREVISLDNLGWIRPADASVRQITLQSIAGK